MADFNSWLLTLTGSREGCFESAKSKVTIAVVCHEVRCVGLAPGERLCISWQVLGRPDGTSHFVPAGELCELKCQFDSVVLMGVWAAEATKSLEVSSKRRACGEARLPLRYLAEKCDGALYHSWMMLDSPGFNDSVASIGFLDPAASDAGDAFRQALDNAPRQLFQPKACLSVCRADELGTSGQILWTADAPRKDRVAHWVPLLRSQQQHVIMCTAQHLQSVQAQKDQRAHAVQRVGTWEETAVLRADDLRRRIERGSSSGPEQGLPQHAIPTEVAQSYEIERHRAEQLKSELSTLQQDLAMIGDEANRKIDQANVRIRTLRQERDDAAREVGQKANELRKLTEAQLELTAEKRKLTEQKEALLQIVEDLHQTCVCAGLNMRGRLSIDSITGYRFP